METASNSVEQFSDYPANLFEESRDHANQWDMTGLMHKPAEKNLEHVNHFADYPVNLFEQSRDHANQWDMTHLWQKKA